MRITIMLAATVAAAVGAVSASAGGAAADPARLVLQRSDFRAATQWSSARSASFERSLNGAGLRGKAVGYTAFVPQGGTEELLVGGLVVAMSSQEQARRVFASYRNPFPATARDIVRLPVSYGDEQVAIVTGEPVRADLRVRKGAVVWRLELKWSGTGKLTRARALAELKTYATKQKRRAGAG